MSYTAIPINSVRAIHDHVLVKDMNFDARTTSTGIHLLGDDMRTAGIRPRWAEVYAIGPEQEKIRIGQWVLVSHGRWTRGVKIDDGKSELTIRRIDPKDVLLITDAKPTDDNISAAVLMDSKERW